MIKKEYKNLEFRRKVNQTRQAEEVQCSAGLTR
jgi:hypothetical protein